MKDLKNIGLIIVDPYNDFLSPGGKRWEDVKEVVQEVNLIENLKYLLENCRLQNIKIFYALHHQSIPGDFNNWKAPSKSNIAMRDLPLFKKGSWGAEVHPQLQPKEGDIIARKHWNSSGFANTDLDFLLKQNGITRIAIAGMATNSCVESTARYGLELGYHVTLLINGVATFSKEEQYASIKYNFPRISHSQLTIEDFISQKNT